MTFCEHQLNRTRCTGDGQCSISRSEAGLVYIIYYVEQDIIRNSLNLHLSEFHDTYRICFADLDCVSSIYFNIHLGSVSKIIRI